MNEIDIVRDISRKLNGAGFPFMLTGSMAMNYYAVPRMTRDIDVVIAITANDVRRIAGLFEADYYISEQSVKESVARQSMFNLIHLDSVIKVDCIVRKSSEYRRLEFDRRQKIQILDFATWIVSKEDLIISKLFWAKDSHSELQLRDVKNLLATGFDAFISSAGRTSWNWIFYYGSVCMTDTLPEIERLLREKMMARTAEERFIMGAQMFDAAVTMVDASLPPNLPEAERKWRRLERIYGTQLLPREMIR